MAGLRVRGAACPWVTVGCPRVGVWRLRGVAREWRIVEWPRSRGQLGAAGCVRVTGTECPPREGSAFHPWPRLPQFLLSCNWGLPGRRGKSAPSTFSKLCPFTSSLSPLHFPQLSGSPILLTQGVLAGGSGARWRRDAITRRADVARQGLRLRGDLPRGGRGGGGSPLPARPWKSRGVGGYSRTGVRTGPVGG